MEQTQLPFFDLVNEDDVEFASEEWLLARLELQFHQIRLSNRLLVTEYLLKNSQHDRR
jgi:hypothetical protein